MRFILAVGLLLTTAIARADRILLVPLDSRPASGQFAQMIAKMCSVDINMPDYGDLGRFTNPGSPDRILDWLETANYQDVSSVIVSTDMIAYGGLIASRVDDTPMSVAMARLKRLEKIRRAHPDVKFYAYSAIMRLAPTATRKSSGWRIQVARYAEIQDRYNRVKDPRDFVKLKHLLKMIPPKEIDDYEATRQRDHALQVELLRMTARGVFDYLILGQDDATVYGPHIPETLHLKQLTLGLGIGGRVYFCEGIDQHSNILLSRALLSEAHWVPRVRIVYSDEEGKRLYNVYESKPIEQSLQDQILASGARLVGKDNDYDYELYVNTPKRRPAEFHEFVDDLESDLDQGFPVCVADINLGSNGIADQQLFDSLFEQQRMMRLLCFAGWNTAGNTMGTAIPAANVYLLARKLRVDPLQRELAQREFLLHRFVNDYAYHKFTRPEAYKIIVANDKNGRDETSGIAYRKADEFVKRDLAAHLDQYFREQFLDRKFFAGTHQYEVTGLTDVKIFLPWPRAYEVRLEFRLLAKEIDPESS